MKIKKHMKKTHRQGNSLDEKIFACKSLQKEFFLVGEVCELSTNQNSSTQTNLYHRTVLFLLILTSFFTLKLFLGLNLVIFQGGCQALSSMKTSISLVYC